MLADIVGEDAEQPVSVAAGVVEAAVAAVFADADLKEFLAETTPAYSAAEQSQTAADAAEEAAHFSAAGRLPGLAAPAAEKGRPLV